MVWRRLGRSCSCSPQPLSSEVWSSSAPAPVALARVVGQPGPDSQLGHYHRRTARATRPRSTKINGQEADGITSLDETSSTSFTIAPDGSCTTDTETGTETCTATTPPAHRHRHRHLPGRRHHRHRHPGRQAGATGQPVPDPQPGQHHRRAGDLPRRRPGRPRQPTRRPDRLHHLHHRRRHLHRQHLTPAPDGSCTTDTKTCTATTAGPHTVTGTYTPVVGIAASDTTGGTATPGDGVTARGTAVLTGAGPPRPR